ncbi:preprotein translocase subunit SecE [uncultured Porticoccus sp.]|uniref:preprotein translocase subunit SecE n=1 Tax=uncultured Porticoccus sp. TaxID=1256050 RepID=UPI0030DB06BC|tara:strand:- start:189 stop:557 length:369 start_codon:yes stop_codon:yes gene_type:complete
MSSATEEKQYRLDGLKWLLVVLLVSAAIYGNYYFATESLLYRVIAILAVALVAGFVALQTRKGDSFITLLRGAYTEARRVIWPTRQERNQTTLMVVVVVLVMSLILWGLDTLFGWLATMVIG